LKPISRGVKEILLCELNSAEKKLKMKKEDCDKGIDTMLKAASVYFKEQLIETALASAHNKNIFPAVCKYI